MQALRSRARIYNVSLRACTLYIYNLSNLLIEKSVVNANLLLYLYYFSLDCVKLRAELRLYLGYTERNVVFI